MTCWPAFPRYPPWPGFGRALGWWAGARVARITLPAGEDRFTAGEKWLRTLFEGAEADDQVHRPGTGPVAFGSFTFDPASDGSVLIVPRTILGRDPSGHAWLTTISAGRAPRDGRAPSAMAGDLARAAGDAAPGIPADPGIPRTPADPAGPAGPRPPHPGCAGRTAA